MKRIALTGGIACGKSLVAENLRGFGFRTLDADDIVHEIIPDPAERKRLAAEVFSNPEKRRELENRIHPQVKARLEGFDGIAIIPLLFETGWAENYDIICCVASSRETQLERMMTTRGYSREEALGRLAAQMPVAEKAARSDYVINNDGTTSKLKEEVEKFVAWLKRQ